MLQGTKQFAFAVPVTAGNYAPEILYTNGRNLATDPVDLFTWLNMYVQAIVATSQIEVDLLRPGFDPNGGDTSYYLLAVAAITTVGYKGNLLSNGWGGARIRAKSGGTSGTTTIGAAWGYVG